MADSIASTSYAGHGELQNMEEGRQADVDGLSSRIIQEVEGGIQNAPTGRFADREAALETPLHKAVRQRNEGAIVEDWHRFANERDINGMTPLYLAIFLGYSNIVDKLITTYGDDLSYGGPDGQNALHIAALRSKDLTQKVLDHAQNDLGNGPDNGSTPLHFAASVGVKGITRLLLSQESHADSNGMRPIHVAASVGAMDALHALVDGNNDDSSAALLVRDNHGRTFLHVAVENNKTDVVEFICREPTFMDYVFKLVKMQRERRPTMFFRNIFNMKDNDGNTALHLAVKNRDEPSFSHLVGNKLVDLNLVNSGGYTPLDLASKMKTENSFASRHQDPIALLSSFQQNPTEWMIRVLAHSGAYFSARRRDMKFGVVTNQEVQQEGRRAPENVSGTMATESVLVASALIATLTFAAAFTVPGSYKTDGDPRAGTPALGSHYGFKVFIVADMVAFFSAVAATFSLAEYANRGDVDPLLRRLYAQRAVWFFHVALRSVIVAFALGVSVVMWDVSVVTTIIVATAACALVLYGNEALANDLRLVRVMYRRFGFLRSGTLHRATSSHLDWSTWRLRSFYATLAWNVVKLIWTYALIFLVAYIAQLKQKDGN